MSLDSDVALFGTGVAPLVAASHLLSQGRSVLLLNPDHDFFLEDSELPLDPIFPGEVDAAARVQESSPERVLEILRPDFPGAVELWSGVSTQQRPGSRDPAAPHVRSRMRLWLASGSGADPVVARARERLEDLYVECSDRDLKPTLLDGLAAARWFPGFTALSASGPEAGAQGLLVSRGCDYDVSRYRYGLLEFVRERLGPERLITSAAQVEPMPGGVRFHAEGGGRTAKIAEALIVFWTPRLTRWVLEQARRAGTTPAAHPIGRRLWEQWTLVSRDPVDPYALGTYEDMTVWADVEGAPAAEADKGTTRLSMLRAVSGASPANMEFAAGDSFHSIRRLCTELMHWDRVSIRGMRPRAILEWEEGVQAFPLSSRGEAARSIVVPVCDGPLSRVAHSARQACRAVLEAAGGGRS